MSLKKLAIPDGAMLNVVKATNRKERHGKEKIQGITMRLEWWLSDNEMLNQLYPGLQDAVFYVPQQEHAQEKIEGLPDVKKHIRVPGMFPLKLNIDGFAGYTIEFEHGISDSTALALYECKLDKFEVIAHEGGAASVRFNAGSSQQITPELLGLLCSKEGQQVKMIKLTPPQVREQENAGVIDGTSDAFKKDHPLFGQGGEGEDNDLGKDAGDVLAENEAAGKNKPASEVPKAPKGGKRAGTKKPAAALAH